MAESDLRSHQSVINKGSTPDRGQFEECQVLNPWSNANDCYGRQELGQVMANDIMSPTNLNLDKVTNPIMYFKFYLSLNIKITLILCVCAISGIPR